MSTDDTQKARTAQDAPADILSITTSKYNAATIKTNMFGGEIHASNREDLEFGIQVYQDGSSVGLSAGTTWPQGDESSLYTFHALTSEQAREIAQALVDAAETADEAAAHTPPKESERKSFLRRLLS